MKYKLLLFVVIVVNIIGDIHYTFPVTNSSSLFRRYIKR